MSSQLADSGQIAGRDPSELITTEFEPVLHSGNFETFAQFRLAYFSRNEPTLCLVQAAELPAVIAWLRDTDDVVLEDSPESLIALRLARLNHEMVKTRDPLTGLLRRDNMLELLSKTCVRATPDAPVSLILVDIDFFKSLNDEFGHGTGDEALIAAAALLKLICPVSSVQARMGGEQFAVAIQADVNVVKSLAERIRCEFENHHWPHKRKMTVSAGVATTAEPCQPQQLIGRADEAMYSAKAGGRNAVACFDDIFKSLNGDNHEIDVVGLENKARVLSERVTSFITLRTNRMMRNLRKQADTDGLTEVYNRRYLDRRLSSEFNAAETSRETFSIALIDIDHFGAINKEHGWPSGDLVLKSVCKEIAGAIRESDWVGRYGGEEFCIVMPETSLAHAVMVAERVRHRIEKKEFVSTSGLPLNVTLSAGIVQYQPNAGASLADLIERASRHTLEAKRAGRNQLYSDSVS